MLTKSDVAFRHYRKFDADGTVNPRGGSTVAFPKGEAGVYGAAYCSTDDNFEYEFGRRLALERLNAGIEEGLADSIHHSVLPISVKLEIVDSFMENMGYTHITRSKYRRSKKHEA